MVTGTSCVLFGVNVGTAFLKSTAVMPEFSYVFSTLLSLTPVTPVVPDKSGFAIVSLGFLTMSTFVTSCVVKVCVPSLDTTLTSPSPLLAVAVTVAFTKSRGISILPL